MFFISFGTFEFFAKKATVIGIIGNTQGVTIAIRPARNAIKNDETIPTRKYI